MNIFKKTETNLSNIVYNRLIKSVSKIFDIFIKVVRNNLLYKK